MFSLRCIWPTGAAVVWAVMACTTTTALAYSFAGGTGEANDPYQIATAAQLISIGSDPNLLSKHFVLVADIDLDPNLPGGRVFSRAVIAQEGSYTTPIVRQTGQFNGDFNGNGHSIGHLTIRGAMPSYWLGLFGETGPDRRVRNLGVVQVSICGNSPPGGSWGGWRGQTEGSCIVAIQVEYCQAPARPNLVDLWGATKVGALPCATRTVP